MDSTLIFTARADASTAAPVLTVLSHPDPSRVSATFGPVTTDQLGRLTPVFHSRDGVAKPLEFAAVSRTPVRLSRQGNDLLVDRSESKMTLEINGVELDRTRTLTTAELDAGVVLCLSGVVTLLARNRLVDFAPLPPTFGLIGDSAGMRQVRRDLRAVAGLDVPVLIRGESGTGKELIARALHQHSKRADRPYEALNIAGVPGSLAASELFGHVKGAFTGADQARTGCFTRARGGTLFLDEIGDAPVDVQAQLLRVLETHDYRAIGGHEQLVADVRLLSATDANMQEAIAAGRFREALFHRLAGFQINVPALRDRREDIGPLVYHFIREELAGLGLSALLEPRSDRLPWLSGETVAQLARYDWPGNVRQLRNVCRQIVIGNRDDEETMSGDELDRVLGRAQSGLPTPAPRPNARRSDVASSDSEPEPESESESESSVSPRDRVTLDYRRPDEVSEAELLQALRAHAFRLVPTAKVLRVSRTTLYALIDACPAVRKASTLPAREVDEALAASGGDVAAAAQQLEVSEHALKLRIKALQSS